MFVFSGCSGNAENISPEATNDQIQVALIEITPSPKQSLQNTPQEKGTPTPLPDEASSQPSPASSPGSSQIIGNNILYSTQFGDSLAALASRFDVSSIEIKYSVRIPEQGFIDPGTLLIIPNMLDETTSNDKVLPDSALIFSSAFSNFDTISYVDKTDGYLVQYRQLLGDGWYTGGELVDRVAINNSINPQLLLTIIEYQSGWFHKKPRTNDESHYPMDYMDHERKELYAQISWVCQQLNIGYYGWRSGAVTGLEFPDGTYIRLAPDLNAGTVGLLYLFSKLYEPEEFQEVIYSPQNSVIALYDELFGDPWVSARAVEPIIPGNLMQPIFELPFEPDTQWNFTGGPHSAWGSEGATAAIDFAPMGVRGCGESQSWVTAMATGEVVRIENGLVIIDLDMDGNEHTGWTIMYMHIASSGRVEVGDVVATDEIIGHPSCAGGISSGTHTHIARRYNGEWILADGPVPFVMGGWQVRAGDQNYSGYLAKEGVIIPSSHYSEAYSIITR